MEQARLGARDREERAAVLGVARLPVGTASEEGERLAVAAVETSMVTSVLLRLVWLAPFGGPDRRGFFMSSE